MKLNYTLKAVPYILLLMVLGYASCSPPPPNGGGRVEVWDEALRREDLWNSGDFELKGFMFFPVIGDKQKTESAANKQARNLAYKSVMLWLGFDIDVWTILWLLA